MINTNLLKAQKKTQQQKKPPCKMINIAFVSQSFLLLQAKLSNSTSKDSITDSQMVPEYRETSNITSWEPMEYKHGSPLNGNASWLCIMPQIYENVLSPEGYPK